MIKVLLMIALLIVVSIVLIKRYRGPFDVRMTDLNQKVAAFDNLDQQHEIEKEFRRLHRLDLTYHQLEQLNTQEYLFKYKRDVLFEAHREFAQKLS